MLTYMGSWCSILCVFGLGAALPASCESRPLVRVPAGSEMRLDGYTSVPVRVAVSAFLMGATEVTQQEFTSIMGYNPSHYRGADRPVETVSWWEAIRFCNLRSLREGLEPCYDLTTGKCHREKSGYRLPTDAEWSWALGLAKIPSGEEARKIAHLGFTKQTDTSIFQDALRKGTLPVGTYPPNRLGLYDMLGNVWEWCDDYFDPTGAIAQAVNPAGPVWGFEKVIRGGSFLTAVTSWARGYRSSMDPAARSPYTGFRVCRSAGKREAPAPPRPIVSRIPPKAPPQAVQIKPLAPPGMTVSEWRQVAAGIRRRWLEVLGAPRIHPPVPEARLLQTFSEGGCVGKLMVLRTEPDAWERIYLLEPAAEASTPRPVVIVPFYDVDAAAGQNLGGRRYAPPGVRSYAYLIAQQGFTAAAIRWFGESYGESYDEAVSNLARRHPGCTGLGKWVWDASRLVDYLVTLPQVNPERIGIIGHSLGGKMALYAAAFDPRISVVVSSEPGIGLGFSNYDHYWYLGEAIQRLPPGSDQHELLGLIAPRPFLLVAGESADGDKSWPYVEAARSVYALFGKPDSLGVFNHRAGHTPTPEAVEKAMAWLAHFLLSGVPATQR